MRQDLEGGGTGGVWGGTGDKPSCIPARSSSWADRDKIPFGRVVPTGLWVLKQEADDEAYESWHLDLSGFCFLQCTKIPDHALGQIHPAPTIVYSTPKTVSSTRNGDNRILPALPTLNQICKIPCIQNCWSFTVNPNYVQYSFYEGCNEASMDLIIVFQGMRKVFQSTFA